MNPSKSLSLEVGGWVGVHLLLVANSHLPSALPDPVHLQHACMQAIRHLTGLHPIFFSAKNEIAGEGS
jgi:hypothetical protein